MLTPRAQRIVVLSALFVIAAATSIPAAAQPSDAPVRLRLVGQPLWHTPGDPLDLALQIVNASPEPLEGFLLRIEDHSRISSRSALHEVFDGDAGFSSSSFSKYYDELEVPAGGSERVVVREPAEDLTAIANARYEWNCMV